MNILKGNVNINAPAEVVQIALKGLLSYKGVARPASTTAAPWLAQGGKIACLIPGSSARDQGSRNRLSRSQRFCGNDCGRRATRTDGRDR